MDVERSLPASKRTHDGLSTLVDTHNHLAGWSPDASQTYEEILEATARRGIAGVAISDHYDPDCVTSSGDPWIFDPDAYMETFYPRRRRPSTRAPGDPVGFLVAVEVGWMPETSGTLHRLLDGYPFDFSIVSLHYLHHHDPYSHADQVYTGPLEAVYTEVIEAIADSAEDMSEARIVGHYDFFSRYAPIERSKMCYHHAPEAFDRLFRVMAKNDQVLEINTGTVDALTRKKHYTLEDAMPDRAILMRYRELGGRYVSIASDAHAPRQNGRFVRETLAYLTRLGFDQTVWYEAGERFVG